MPVVILILVVVLVLSLNIFFGNKFRTMKEAPPKVKVEETFTEPVSCKYPILFWFAVYHCVRLIVAFLWDIIFTRAWNKYTDQFVAQHHLHSSVPFLKLQYIVSMVASAAVYFGIYVYLLRSKDKKLIIALLRFLLIFVGFDILLSLVRPSLHLLYALFAGGFNALVLWSLLRSEPDIFKLLHLHQKKKG